MVDYKVEYGLGDHIIIEPIETNSVIKTALAVYRVISFGVSYEDLTTIHVPFLVKGDLIAVEPEVVMDLRVGSKKLFYIRKSNVICKLSEEK